MNPIYVIQGVFISFSDPSEFAGGKALCVYRYTDKKHLRVFSL